MGLGGRTASICARHTVPAQGTLVPSHAYILQSPLNAFADLAPASRVKMYIRPSNQSPNVLAGHVTAPALCCAWCSRGSGVVLSFKVLTVC